MAERIEIIVTTDSGAAAGELDKLADQVEALTGVRPEVTVAADTADAADGLDSVAETAADLDSTEATVDLSIPAAGDAVADLDEVADAADAAAEAASEVGPAADAGIGSVKGTTKDMLRPMGLAKSSVGDLTDAFQLFADQTVASMGLTQAQIGKLAGALPVVGVAIGLAVSAWQTYNKEQKKAAEDADKLADAYRGVGDALAAGDAVKAAEDLTAANQDLFDSAADLGIPYQELTDFITGVSDQLPHLAEAHERVGEATAKVTFGTLAARDAFREAAAAGGTLGDRSTAAAGSIDTYTDAMGGAADQASDLAGFLKEVNDALDTQKSALDVADSLDTLADSTWKAAIATDWLGKNAEAAKDANRELTGDMIDAKQDVLDYAEAVGDIPPEEITKILALIDQHKLTEAEAAFAKVSRPRTSDVKAAADTKDANADIDHAARDRNAHIKVDASWIGKATRWMDNPTNWAAGSGQAVAPTGMAATPSAVGAAPVVHVSVDARGAIDPYSVGLAVERAAGAWGRVSGQWRPGQRAAG